MQTGNVFPAYIPGSYSKSKYMCKGGGDMKKRGKRIAAVFLAAAMTMLPVGTVYGEEIQNGAEPATDDPAARREQEREAGYKIPADTNSLEGWPEGPAVYADSAVVMDMNTGAVLYEKQADEKHYPASITKVLSVLVALENSELTDEVTFSEDSVAFMEPGDASIGMTPGEVLSMEDALYAMLLASANEVSYAVAENVGQLMGGDYSTFIEKMNEKSQELGCTNSHWMNANGLHDEQHYTSARDMAKIASAVYQYDEFRKITQTLSYTIGPTNLVKENRVFQQNHKMLWPENENYYEYCTGGKTGYTDQARTTLVTFADNGETQLVAVVLYDFGNDAYVDTRAMFDYAFDNFDKVMLTDEKTPEEIESYQDMESYVLLPSGADFSDLDKEIEITDSQSRTGTVTYTYQGQNVGSADVVVTREYVEAENEESVSVTEKETEAIRIPLIVRILIGAAAALVVVFIILFSVLKYRQIKRRKARRRRRQQMRKRQEMRKRRSDRSM